MIKNVNLAIGHPSDEIKARYLTYNIFVFWITNLAILGMLAYYFLPLRSQVKQVLYISDFIACILLMFDFFLTWHLATDRRHYLLHQGWLDFLGSIPSLLLFRLLRVFRMVRIWRRIRSTASQEVLQQARQRLGESTLMVGILLVYIVVTLGSIGVVLVESPDPQANIKTGGDAVWWSFVTIATVGYGDQYPVTSAGRVIGVMMMVVGVSVFSILTGFLALSFQNRRARQQEAALDRLTEELRQLRHLLEQGQEPGRDLRIQRPASPADAEGPAEEERRA